jgi:hypothetical protein
MSYTRMHTGVVTCQEVSGAVGSPADPGDGTHVSYESCTPGVQDGSAPFHPCRTELTKPPSSQVTGTALPEPAKVGSVVWTGTYLSVNGISARVNYLVNL